MTPWIKRTDQEPPRDGTTFIAANANWSDATLMYWTSALQRWLPVDPDEGEANNFTHWLPLPPLPEDAA